jgi:hypothetical protein
MTKTSTKPKKAARSAKRKRATSRPFPYEQVAKLWSQEKTIPEIAKATRRVGKGDDPYHSLRVALTKMHKGYKNSNGNVVKLPHRMSRTAVAACAKAGKRASK